MEKCNVTFTSESGQKIICDFILHDDDSLEFKPHYEPEVDLRTNLGLSGKLCEIFINALTADSENNA